jgi:hypothetical protein
MTYDAWKTTDPHPERYDDPMDLPCPLCGISERETLSLTDDEWETADTCAACRGPVPRRVTG